MVSPVKPALLETKHGVLQGQDYEETEADKQIGDRIVYLDIVLVLDCVYNISSIFSFASELDPGDRL